MFPHKARREACRDGFPQVFALSRALVWPFAFLISTAVTAP